MTASATVSRNSRPLSCARVRLLRAARFRACHPRRGRPPRAHWRCSLMAVSRINEREPCCSAVVTAISLQRCTLDLWSEVATAPQVAEPSWAGAREDAGMLPP
jgi:hypothetical protein